MELYKGIFWYMDGRIFCRKVHCDKNGVPLEPVEFSSKSGDNFNHKAEWEKLPKKVTGGKPYNYYPRGRVEIQKSKATVYLNPTLNEDDMTQKIALEFGLQALQNVTVKSDGSAHYEALIEQDQGLDGRRKV